MSESAGVKVNERFLLGVLATIQFTTILDFLIIMPLGPQYMRVFSISPAQFGVMVSAYALSAGSAGVAAGFILDRFDRKKALLLLYFGFAIGTLLCALAPGYRSLVAARVIAGAFAGVAGATIMAVISDVIPEERRGRAMGVLMSSFSLASVLGVPIGLWLANHFGWHAPFVLLTVLSLVILAAAAVAVPSLRSHLQIVHAEGTLARMWSVLVHPNHLRAYGLVAMMTGASFVLVPYISAYMVKNVGLKETDLPHIYFFGGLFTLFTMNYIGHMADRFGKRPVFILTVLCSTVPTLVLTHLPRLSVTMAVTVTTVFMICMSGRMVPGMALLTSSVEPRYRGGFMSLISSVQQFCSGVGAWVGGLLIGQGVTGELTGYNRVGWLSVVLAMLSIVLVRQLRVVPQAPAMAPATESL